MNIIKQYNQNQKYNFIKCPHCNKTFTDEQWDKRTRQGFNDPTDNKDIRTIKNSLKIVKIDEENWAWHTCPNCDYEMGTDEIYNYNFKEEDEED